MVSSDDEDGKVKVLKFSGKDKEWREWSGKFMSQATLKGYKEVLFETKPDGSKLSVPRFDEELDESDADGKAKAKVRKMNVKAYCMLKLSCSGVAYNLVEEAVTDDLPDGDAAFAWKKLCDRYSATETSDQVLLKRQFNNRVLKAGEDPDKWFLDLEHLRRRLLTMKAPVTDLDTIAHILNNMGNKYKELVTIIEGQLDGLTLEQLKKRVRAYYKRQTNLGHEADDDDDDENGAALVMFKGRCSKCGKFGHKAVDCPSGNGGAGGNQYKREQKGPKVAGRCNWCNKPGHIERFCWAKKRGSPKADGAGERANIGHHNGRDNDNGICLLTNDSVSDDNIPDSIWLVDSGASSHMTYDKGGMFETVAVDEHVTMGNGEIVHGTLRGKLKVMMGTADGEVPVLLHSVLYVPELCYNLFSVGSVTEGGGSVSMGNESILIKTKRGVELELPRSSEVSKLFGISCERCIVNNQAFILKEGTRVDINEAHELLGHLGHDEMLQTAKVFGWILTGKLHICEGCCQAKGRQKNLPKDEKERAKNPGERLFIDIASVNKKSMGGAKYWLLVVDDFSRKKW
eukprot:Pompholyxophrys_punicea_v1_NODE_28_length_5163_cov_5.731206.p1 type:complete len:571 gc:universal NODE_28_length_5163_cov_5.731206:57-1769(+)